MTGEGGPDSLDSLCPRRLELGAPAICARGHPAQGRQATQPPVRSRAWDPAHWPPFPWTPEGRLGGGAGQSRSCGELESKGLRCLGSCEAPRDGSRRASWIWKEEQGSLGEGERKGRRRERVPLSRGVRRPDVVPPGWVVCAAVHTRRLPRAVRRSAGAVSVSEAFGVCAPSEGARDVHPPGPSPVEQTPHLLPRPALSQDSLKEPPAPSWQALMERRLYTKGDTWTLPCKSDRGREGDGVFELLSILWCAGVSSLVMLLPSLAKVRAMGAPLPRAQGHGRSSEQVGG